MSKLKLLVLTILFSIVQIIAQNNDYNINLKVFEIKNTSIRATEIIDDETVWFAGSNGKYGRVFNSEIEIDSVHYENKALNFRSIAYNGDHIFILSIANPAILYKISPQKFQKDPPKMVYKEEHDKVFYDSMTFFDHQNGIAIGDQTDACMSVILTSNGGNTWEKVPCENLSQSVAGEGAFAASDTNVKALNKTAWMVTGGKIARVYRSTNYGKNWKVYDTPIVQGETMTGIFTVDFYDEKYGIIMGGNWEEKSSTVATKALTQDGGKSWQVIGNKEIPGYISCVRYIPNTGGMELMAVSTEGIYHSADQGNHWIKISNEGYYSINFVNKNTAWLSGHEKIAKLSLK